MSVDHRLPDVDINVLTINDLKERGSKALPAFVKGAMDLLTILDNEAAFDRYKLRPRTLKDVSSLDTSTTILGTKGAAMNNIPMTLSTYTSKTLEDVIAQGKGNPYMMHICFFKDRRKTLEIVKRAEAAGYKAVVVSCDVAALGLRLNEYRNNFKIPPSVSKVLLSDESGGLPDHGEHLEWDSSLTWEGCIEWLRNHTKMEIWLKGILNPDDVALAIKHGVDGVLISNHGGRQLDGVPATLDALRACVPVAKNKIKLAVDGGIRRGSDIFKAIALGADFCMAGRPPLCKSVDEISTAHLWVLKSDGILSHL
ncbi:hypothetical protein CEP52_014824 [Fusarium oligoseptatum]|uniref:FMN hydroxy acid dehydrogenase domain-containing protein n=1 Tax=Fusarium oligoseptatum TaxID=2604345 RepID=A0A428SIY6_9HYPO|nr:hypothetical protein CEP52_014824 [Fusarium oligoseptatum]